MSQAYQSPGNCGLRDPPAISAEDANAGMRGERVSTRLGRDVDEGERKTHNRGALKNTADDPDPPRDDDRPFAADEIGELRDGEGPDEGAGGHGGDDGALSIRGRVAEGVLVSVIGEDAGHGRNVQSEEPTADTCERTDDVLKGERGQPRDGARGVRSVRRDLQG